MASRTGSAAEGRGDALSRERIVAAAIEFLDASGEAGLTFRALSSRLATGPGAIYGHVAGKDQLVGAAAETVLVRALTLGPDERSPRDTVRALCLRLFDAIDAYPWIAGRLARDPWQPVMLQTVERIGRQLQLMEVRQEAWFAVVSALLGYTLGVGGQNAANGRDGAPLGSRADFLDDAASAWERLDPAEHPFMHAIAPQMRHHDDREQFLAGIDLILDGAAARR